jgi:type I site-specific restriction endonuclease
MKGNKTGRPSSLTEEVVSKLEHSIMDGANITEACQVAGISRETYYKGLKENELFADRMTDAEEYPTKVAKKNLIERIKRKDVETSKWWLERKKKDEFSTRTEQTGANGAPLAIGVVSYAATKPKA